MKPSTVIIIVVTILVLAGVTVWVVLAQAKNTLAEAGKTAKTAGDITKDVKDLVTTGTKIWGDAKNWYEGQES